MAAPEAPEAPQAHQHVRQADGSPARALSRLYCLPPHTAPSPAAASCVQVVFEHGGEVHEVGPCPSEALAHTVRRLLQGKGWTNPCSGTWLNRPGWRPVCPSSLPCLPQPPLFLMVRFHAAKSAGVEHGPAASASFGRVVQQLKQCCKSLLKPEAEGAKCLGHTSLPAGVRLSKQGVGSEQLYLK